MIKGRVEEDTFGEGKVKLRSSSKWRVIKDIMKYCKCEFLLLIGSLWMVLHRILRRKVGEDVGGEMGTWQGEMGTWQVVMAREKTALKLLFFNYSFIDFLYM